MAKDIAMVWDGQFLSGDFLYGEGDLLREEGLRTAVMISLFTDRRADEDDPLDDINDKKGWWGDLTTEDDQIGSKLWLLDRAKTTSDTPAKAQQYIEEALQWMIDDKVAIKIEVKVERAGNVGMDILAANIKIYQSDGNVIAFKFDDLWKGEMNNAIQ